MAQETTRMSNSGMTQSTAAPTSGTPSLMASLPGVNQVTSFLTGGNPMTTPVGQLVERATEASRQSGEDWALYLEICDLVNETDEGPKDAIRALRKRFQAAVGNRDFASVSLALTVLETCVKNCGRRFHAQVAQKEFLKDFVGIVSPKHEPPVVIQDRILSLIHVWSVAFQGAPELRAVEQTYQDLKTRGIVFPDAEKDTTVPIITPKRSNTVRAASPGTGGPERPSPARGGSVREPSNRSTSMPVDATIQPLPNVAGVRTASNANNVQRIVRMSGPVTPTPEQMAKLRSELDVVNGNVSVMGDMLNEMAPGEEDPADLELLHELNRTCRAMQTRLLELIEKIAVEEVIEELLHVNDDLNNVFLRFERFERYRTGKTGAAVNENVKDDVPSPVPYTPPKPAPMAETNLLIDFTSPPAASAASEVDVNRQLANLGLDGDDGSRQVAKKQNALNAKEDEFKEMEAWLGATAGGDDATVADGSNAGPISSSEFDDFLASRLQGGPGDVVAPAAAPVRGIGDVPSIVASSGAVPRANAATSKRESDQELLLG